jgi:AcrR family transcriptional regulator
LTLSFSVAIIDEIINDDGIINLKGEYGMTDQHDSSQEKEEKAAPGPLSRGRRGQRQAQTRTQLLSGARNIFARIGVAEATIAQITTEANVGFGTFYLYFKTKEDALHAVLVEGFVELNTQIDELLQAAKQQQQPWEEALKSCVHAYLRFAWRNRDLMQIMFAEQSRLQQTEQQVFLRFAWRIAQLLRYAHSLLPDAESPFSPHSHDLDGYIEYPLNLLTVMIVAILTRTAIWWLRQYPEENSQTLPRSLDEIGGLITQFMVAGLASVLTTEEEK